MVVVKIGLADFFILRVAKFLREGGLGRLLSLGILGVDKNNASHYFLRFKGGADSARWRVVKIAFSDFLI